MIPTPDGENLSAFYIPSQQPGSRHANTTILMFHGNAGNIGHRIPIARMFCNTMGCNVFMLEYRGYGLSTGSPDETGLMIDAQTAYDYLRQRSATRDHNIVIYGQSLGGAVSIQLVAKNQGDRNLIGLVLENTFLSMRKLIPRFVPFLSDTTRFCYPDTDKREKKVLSHRRDTLPTSAIKSGRAIPFFLPSPKCQSSSSQVSWMR